MIKNLIQQSNTQVQKHASLTKIQAILQTKGNTTRSTSFTMTKKRRYTKSELMLMRRVRAYSSSCSQVVLVYIHPFHRNSLFCSRKSWI